MRALLQGENPDNPEENIEPEEQPAETQSKPKKPRRRPKPIVIDDDDLPPADQADTSTYTSDGDGLSEGPASTSASVASPYPGTFIISQIRVVFQYLS